MALHTLYLSKVVLLLVYFIIGVNMVFRYTLRSFSSPSIEYEFDFPDQESCFIWIRECENLRRQNHAIRMNHPSSVPHWLNFLHEVLAFQQRHGAAYVPIDITSSVDDTLGCMGFGHDDFAACRFPQSDDAAAVERIEAALPLYMAGRAVAPIENFIGIVTVINESENTASETDGGVTATNEYMSRDSESSSFGAAPDSDPPRGEPM